MKKLVIGNWKMNPDTLEQARLLVMRTEHRMNQVKDRVEAVICAPFIYLPPLSHFCHLVKLGAQNMNWLEKGAITGEISAHQLKLLKVDYVILGHSERRLYLGETDSVVNAKIMTALKYKLIPIVCLGGEENAKEKNMAKIISKQYRGVTAGLTESQLQKIVFVYEPSWAISTMQNSAPASSKHANEMIIYVQKMLGRKVGAVRAKNMPMLYGGTVNAINVQEFARHPEIGGALVGAASLDSENFWQIIKEFHRESVH